MSASSPHNGTARYERFSAVGTVKSYVDDQYGFVTPSAQDSTVTKDIFVDRKCVRDSHLETLKPGMRVLCKGIVRPKGPKATKLEVLPA